MTELWVDAPLGMAVYSPIFDEHGEFRDLRLDWFNHALTKLTRIRQHTIGKYLSEINADGWAAARDKFAVLVATGRPFSYYRHYENKAEGVMVDVLATAWTAHGMVAVLVRDTNLDPVPIGDATDVDTALRLLDQRTRKTEALAQLLVDNKQHAQLESLVDPAGVEPATSRTSRERSAD